MEGVIARGVARRLLHPRIEGLTQPLSLVLNGEVDERGGAAEGGGARAGFKIVGTGGAAEGHVEMSVHVDAAGQNQFAGRVSILVAFSDRRSIPMAVILPFAMAMSAV